MKTIYLLIITRPNKLKIVSNTLSKCEEIKDIYEVYGQYDIVAKVEVDSLEDMQTFFQNNISIIEGIRKTETLISMGDKVENNKPEEDIGSGENAESDEDPAEEDVEFKV